MALVHVQSDALSSYYKPLKLTESGVLFCFPCSACGVWFPATHGVYIHDWHYRCDGDRVCVSCLA